MRLLYIEMSYNKDIKTLPSIKGGSAMLLFPERKDVAGLIEWFEQNFMFPFPIPECADYRTLTRESEVRINYGDYFRLGFKGMDPIHDVFRCDMNMGSRIRVMRKIKDCVLDGNYVVEEGEILPFTINRLTVFVRSQEYAKVGYE